MSHAAKIARRLLENDEGDVEEIATNWISVKEPRYSTSGGFLTGNTSINYDGRVMVYRAPRWEPVNKWVSLMLFGTEKLSWEDARRRLESGGSYFGWIQINLKVGEETRQRWLFNQPVHIRKMVQE